MSHAYSADLRSRVIDAISAGLSTRKAADRFGIGISTAGTWYRWFRATGERAARKQGKPPGSKLDAHETVRMILYLTVLIEPFLFTSFCKYSTVGSV